MPSSGILCRCPSINCKFDHQFCFLDAANNGSASASTIGPAYVKPPSPATVEVSAFLQIRVSYNSSEPSLCNQLSFLDSNGVPLTTLQSVLGSFSQDESILISFSSKRAAVKQILPSGPSQCSLQQMVHLGQPSQNGFCPNSISLPPFSGRECLLDREESNYPQTLFSVSAESSRLFMNNAVSGIRTLGKESDSVTLPSNYAGIATVDFMANTPSGIMYTGENPGELISPNQTFVKVYKLGSFGRSLDIAKFSSYNELRLELSQMFGLEGLLEEPLRSGWQLVFVDRENEVLLLGDGPWPEFVSSLHCIKILSPQEVHEMGKQGLELQLHGHCPKALEQCLRLLKTVRSPGL